jgi:periplasmic mercuric ion binding protein
MKRLTFLFLITFIIFPSSSLAAPRKIRLDVQKMTCSVCPLTVKKALEKVPSVQRVSVDYTSKTATVEFDDAATPVDKLTEATKNAGYPSTIRKDGQ